MPKKNKSGFKESFDVFSKCEAFYTGGKIQFTNDGNGILSICEGKVKIFHTDDGKTTDATENFEGEEVNSFILAEDGDTLICAAKNGIMRHWQLSKKVLEKTWKSVHVGLVNCMTFDSTTTLLATGGSDSTIKVWDIVQKYYTHNLKGGKGVYNKVCFYKIGSDIHVFGAADDYHIHIWNLHSNERIASLMGHYSTVTDLIFKEDTNQMISCSRDKVILLWDLSTFQILKTTPVYECIESCMLVPEGIYLPNTEFKTDELSVITAGDKGILKIWNLMSGKCIYEQPDSLIVLPKDSSYEGSLITQAVYVPALEAIAVISYEHNILLYSIKQFDLKNQFVGYNDDILSIKFIGSSENQVAVATNSCHIKIFELPSFSCQLLKGHSDIVMCLDVFSKHNKILVSGSKDNSVKVWSIGSDSFSMNCLYTGYGHTDSVTSISCSKGKSKIFASGSEDTTLKLWQVPENAPLVSVKNLLTPYCTVKAHDKLINSIDISQNDKFVASGSQDHTAKIWDSAELSLLAVLRGHKKSVWCVKFSPVDLVLATSSGDETIRIWSLLDFSCLKVFQGHEATVLQVLFLSLGSQLLTSASDGNIKLWDIKNNLCVKTLDQHNLKVWTLDSSKSEEYFVSGGADSNIVVWKDTTKIEKEKVLKEKESFILQEQELMNLLHQEKWTKALGLAITLDKPYQAYKIIEEMLLKENGETILTTVLEKLREDQKEALMKFSTEWVTNSKTYYSAVLVINFFYRTYDSEDLLKLPNMSSYIQETLPYFDRHFKRVERRCQEMQILNFLTDHMSR